MPKKRHATPASRGKLLLVFLVTHKRGERVHPARDEDLRAAFISRLAGYRASQIVVVDESSTSENATERRWGWAPRGVAYRMTQTARDRAGAWSILPAIGINGYLDYEICRAAFNTESFSHYIERLLLKMNPFPGPRSVLIMDYCKTHHGIELQLLCAARGVILEYLPAYSPDMSPIEESFSVLKAWLRKNRDLARPWIDMQEFGQFLHIAVEEADLKGRARELFANCGYIVEEDDQDVDHEYLREEA